MSNYVVKSDSTVLSQGILIKEKERKLIASPTGYIQLFVNSGRFDKNKKLLIAHCSLKKKRRMMREERRNIAE